MRRERTVRNVNGTSEIWKESFVDIRSCFKFIPRQIETYVEADWSPRYAVNSGLLTKIKGFKMRDRGSIWPEHTCLK